MHRHLAVLGSPIAHSRSPRIHRAAYEVLGLPWHYEAFDCQAAQLQQLLESRGEEWLGFSVTMPLKAEAHRLSSVLDPVAIESGVANTLLRLIDSEGSPAWAGFNTDVAGLTAALSDANIDSSHTIVLGAGATAVSALLAARERGASRVSVLARRLDAAAELAARFSDDGSPLVCDAHTLAGPHTEIFETATSVISTLPGQAAASLTTFDQLTRVPLFDVAYDPWPSPLAERWQKRGGESHEGIGMLVHQALLQLRIFVNGDASFALQNEGDVLQAMRLVAKIAD